MKRISAMIHTRDITSEDRYLVMITRNGTVKRLPVTTLKKPPEQRPAGHHSGGWGTS